MKDPEFEALKAHDSRSSLHAQPYIRRNFSPKQVLTCIGVAVFLVGCVFGIGILASVCGMSPSPSFFPSFSSKLLKLDRSLLSFVVADARAEASRRA